MQVDPYVFFDGRCQEAIDFYKQAVGAEVVFLMRYGEAPPMGNPDQSGGAGESNAHKLPDDAIMHCSLRVGSSEMMVSDGRCGGEPKFEGFSLSLTCDDPGQAENMFAALSNGGNVHVPLSPTFFSPAFGMVADKFGVVWMVYVKQS